MTDAREPLRVRLFSIFENSARLLLRNYPLDHVRIHPEDPHTVQLVLVGFGLMGEAILTRAAKTGHYANSRRLQVSIIDRDAERDERLFRHRYPQFDQIADANFLQLDAEEPETQSRIVDLCTKPNTISTVAISFDDPPRELSIAFSLAKRLPRNVPIRVRLGGDRDLAELIHAHDTRSAPITAFGAISEACHVANWTEGSLDKAARALHGDYVRKLPDNERNPANPSAAPWERLSEDLRESNRQAADHIPVKLRALGYHETAEGDDKDPGPPVSEFEPGEIEILARMEHRRWMAERYLAGWVQGLKDNERRVNPWLVEWGELPENIQDYDRNSARIIPGVLRMIGREIRR